MEIPDVRFLCVSQWTIRESGLPCEITRERRARDGGESQKMCPYSVADVGLSNPEIPDVFAPAGLRPVRAHRYWFSPWAVFVFRM
jgi:hypothetical protein